MCVERGRAACVAVAGPVCAEPVALTPIVELRARYETVEQDGLRLSAEPASLLVGVVASSSVTNQQRATSKCSSWFAPLFF